MVINDEKLTLLKEKFKEYYDCNLKYDYEKIEKIRINYWKYFILMMILFLAIDYLFYKSGLCFSWMMFVLGIIYGIKLAFADIGIDFKLDHDFKKFISNYHGYGITMFFFWIFLIFFCFLLDTLLYEPMYSGMPFMVIRFFFLGIVVLFVLKTMAKKLKFEVKRLTCKHAKIFTFFTSIIPLKSCKNSKGICMLYNLIDVELLPDKPYDDAYEIDTDDGYRGRYKDVNFEFVEETYWLDKSHGISYTRGLFILFYLNDVKNIHIKCLSKKYNFGLFLPHFILLFLGISGIALVIYAYFCDKDISGKGIDIFGDSVILLIASLPILFNEIKKLFSKKKDELEDVVFSKKWRVYVSDPIKARTILTPALMDRMLNVRKLFSARNFEFAFKDNKLIISMRSGMDMFETVSLFRKADNVDRVFKVVEQFYSIFQIIDLLKLEGTTGNGNK